MKLHKNLKIWLGLSIISIFVLLFWTNRPMNIIPFLVSNDAYFQKIMDENSDKILDELYKQVEAYPAYQEYYEKAESADSLIQHSLKNIATVDLNIQQKYIFDSLLTPLNYYHKEDIQRLMPNIYAASNDELAQRKLQNWSLNLAKSTMLQKNRIALLNFYAEKASGTCCFCFNWPEPILINPFINNLVNEKSQLQFGVSYNMNLKDVQLWINDEAHKVKDGRTRYKKQATKSGWNELKIKYQGEFRNQILTDSLTYRYYVCD